MNQYFKTINHNAFNIQNINGLKFLTLDILNYYGFNHCFTTRIGGVSTNEFESLNLSLTRENNKNNKIENYRRVCNALNINYESLTLVNYEHGNKVYILNENDKGKGISKPSDLPYCDALVSLNPEFPAVTLHADCVPIFMVDKKNGIAAIAHAGWRGTILNIVSNLVNTFNSNLGSALEDIIVGIGPHIMDCCFEIKSDVSNIFIENKKNDCLNERDGKTFGNIQQLILMQLKELNILPQNIYCADMCTFCLEDLFYSHRRDHGQTGAMASFITARKNL